MIIQAYFRTIFEIVDFFEKGKGSFILLLKSFVVCPMFFHRVITMKVLFCMISKECYVFMFGLILYSYALCKKISSGKYSFVGILGHFTGLLFRYFPDTFGKLFEYFLDTFWILFEYFQDTFGILLNTFEILLGYFWDTFWILLGYFWKTFGILLEYFWDRV